MRSWPRQLPILTDPVQSFGVNGLTVISPLTEISLEDLLVQPLQMSYYQEEHEQKTCEMSTEERRLFIDLL